MWRSEKISFVVLTRWQHCTKVSMKPSTTSCLFDKSRGFHWGYYVQSTKCALNKWRPTYLKQPPLLGPLSRIIPPRRYALKLNLRIVEDNKLPQNIVVAYVNWEFTTLFLKSQDLKCLLGQAPQSATIHFEEDKLFLPINPMAIFNNTNSLLNLHDVRATLLGTCKRKDLWNFSPCKN